MIAHGIGGRVDLPVPRWLFLYGAAAAVVLSFVLLAALWRQPRLEGTAHSRRLPPLLQRLLSDPTLGWVVRGASLLLFVVVTLAAFLGQSVPGANLASVLVYIWFWVGLALAHALLGNLWATLSPWDTLARLLGLGEDPPLRYPPALGTWPAALGLLGFVWMELVYPSGADPRQLGVAILAYTAVTMAGMAAFGREAWNRGAETFAVYFGLLARVAPLARDERGRVVVRPPLRGLPSLAPRPGLLPLVAVALGSTTFDGFSRSGLWLSTAGSLGPVARALAGTAGLLGMVGAVALVYVLSMRAAASVGGGRWRVLAARFVHSLVPIALAYAVAHYFSLLVLEGQAGLALLSDPFGAGWDLLGTASWRPNLTLLSATAIWYVQVVAIVAGHVGGVVLAHDRAVALFPPDRAVRTQYVFLGVMVLFTVSGLVILSGG